MELKEKPKWYEWYICKVWRANYAMNQNDSQRHAALDWGFKTKFVSKPHWCSWTDRDHKIVQDYDRDEKEGKLGELVTFETVDDFIKDLKK